MDEQFKFETLFSRSWPRLLACIPSSLSSPDLAKRMKALTSLNDSADAGVAGQLRSFLLESSPLILANLRASGFSLFKRALGVDGSGSSSGLVVQEKEASLVADILKVLPCALYGKLVCSW
jgi:hypothetical protein